MNIYSIHIYIQDKYETIFYVRKDLHTRFEIDMEMFSRSKNYMLNFLTHIFLIAKI